MSLSLSWMLFLQFPQRQLAIFWLTYTEKCSENIILLRREANDDRTVVIVQNKPMSEKLAKALSCVPALCTAIMPRRAPQPVCSYQPTSLHTCTVCALHPTQPSRPTTSSTSRPKADR